MIPPDDIYVKEYREYIIPNVIYKKHLSHGPWYVAEGYRATENNGPRYLNTEKLNIPLDQLFDLFKENGEIKFSICYSEYQHDITIIGFKSCIYFCKVPDSWLEFIIKNMEKYNIKIIDRFYDYTIEKIKKFAEKGVISKEAELKVLLADFRG